jgi:hypothetical protein
LGRSEPRAISWRGTVIFNVDGYKYYDVTTGISQIEEYLILSMEIPSDPKEMKNAAFPDVFSVDSVKVYQKAKSPESQSPGQIRGVGQGKRYRLVPSTTGHVLARLDVFSSRVKAWSERTVTSQVWPLPVGVASRSTVWPLNR